MAARNVACGADAVPIGCQNLTLQRVPIVGPPSSFTTGRTGGAAVVRHSGVDAMATAGGVMRGSRMRYCNTQAEGAYCDSTSSTTA